MTGIAGDGDEPWPYADLREAARAAYVLAGSRTSRLTQALVYNGEIATNVQAYQDGKRLDGDFSVVATARPGRGLDTLRTVIDAELARLAAEGPTAREMGEALNATEASFLRGIERVGGKADRLNAYYYQTGTPDSFQADLDRYKAVTAADVQRVVRQYLRTSRVMASVVPQGKPELAAKKAVLTHWKAADLQCDPACIGLDGSPTRVLKVATPPPRAGGEIFKGEPDDIVPQVVAKLKDAVLSARS